MKEVLSRRVVLDLSGLEKRFEMTTRFNSSLREKKRKKEKKTPHLTYYQGPNKPEVQLEGTDDICTTLRNVPSRDRKGHSTYLWPGQLAKIQELEQTSCSKSANYTFASCYKELLVGMFDVVASNVQIKISEYANSESSFYLPLSTASRKRGKSVEVQGS